MPDVAEYKVQLDNYYGPLDLLLHLVKETEVDITAIALARACEQYIKFLSAMERRDIDLSGNFLTLASQLILIKSRTIAPPELAPGTGEEEEEEEGDASLELIRKLLDYKRFKDRARDLDQRMTERSLKYGRPRIKIEGETEQEPLRNLELWDLVLLYSKAMKGTRLEALMSILYRDVPLEIFIDRILNTLTEKKTTSLAELLGESPDRTSILGTFLALLQLAKIQKVTVTQEVVFGDIQVKAVEKPQVDAAAEERAAYDAEVAASRAAAESATPPPPAEPAMPPPVVEAEVPPPAAKRTRTRRVKVESEGEPATPPSAESTTPPDAPIAEPPATT